MITAIKDTYIKHFNVTSTLIVNEKGLESIKTIRSRHAVHGVLCNDGNNNDVQSQVMQQ